MGLEISNGCFTGLGLWAKEAASTSQRKVNKISKQFVKIWYPESSPKEEKREESPFFTMLPPEIRLQVFDHLELKDLATSQTVCKKFHRIAENKALNHIFPPLLIEAIGYYRLAGLVRIRPKNFNLLNSKPSELKPYMKEQALSWGRDQEGRYFLAVRYLSKSFKTKIQEGFLILHQMSPPSRMKISEIDWIAKDSLSNSTEIIDGYLMYHGASPHIPKKFNKDKSTAFQSFLVSLLKNQACGHMKTHLKNNSKEVTDPYVEVKGHKIPRLMLCHQA